MKISPFIISHKLLWVSVIFFLFIFPIACVQTNSLQAESSPLNVSEDEKRGVLLTRKLSITEEADGYADISPDVTRFQARREAIADARQNAVERARERIRSENGISNFVSEPEITVSGQKDYGVENNRYHIWLRAEVVFSFDADMPVRSLNPLKAEVWTSQEKYKSGEKIEIFFKSNRDCYARIVNVKAGGERFQVLPNSFRKINFFKAAKIYKIPDHGDHFDFRASPPFGREQIVVYASEMPLSEALAADTKRGITIEPKQQAENSAARVYKAAWNFITQE